MTEQGARRNQRKTPLTPKKRDAEESTIYAPMRIGGGRIKKAKIPFDPSESNFPKRRFTTFYPNKGVIDDESKKTSASVRESKRIAKKYIEPAPEMGKFCAFCSKHDNKASMNCRDCTAVAHLTCIRSNNGPYLQGSERNWLCPNCETCFHCYESGLVQPLYKCTLCFSSYHLTCHDTNSKEKTKPMSSRRFQCRNCVQYTETIQKKKKPAASSTNQSIGLSRRTRSRSRSNAQIENNGFAGFDLEEINYNSDDNSNQHIRQLIKPSSRKASPIMKISPSYSPTQISHSSNDSNESFPMSTHALLTSNEEVPDTTKWTNKQVYNYFYKYFPNDAKVFKEQEIDGLSLLLMKRSDILSFQIKLGIALKMYLHVLRFQSRKNDISMSWN